MLTYNTFEIISKINGIYVLFYKSDKNGGVLPGIPPWIIRLSPVFPGKILIKSF
jgi:hypothetical protein